MLRVLIVDDNATRCEELHSQIKLTMGGNGICESADCVLACKDKLRNYYDILILDIKLPNRPDGEPSDTHSLDLLYELSERQTDMRSPGQIIGITAFDNSFSTASSDFSKYLRNLILMRPDSADGFDEINNVIRYAMRSRSDQGRSYKYDLCILTALLEESEFVNEIDWGWSQSKPLDESLYYKEGSFDCQGQSFNVVHVTAQKMGLVNTALRAARVIEAFKPRFIAMCGVCGGFANKGVSIGDLIFVENTWELFSGKYHAACGLIPVQEGYQRGVPTWLIENFRECVQSIPNNSILYDVDIHSGVMACSSAVIANTAIVDEIFSLANRKALGVEMEIFSLYSAALDAGFPRPTPFAVKGVSDLADENKGDSNRDRPARSSAQMLKFFFEQRMRDILPLAGSS